MSLPQPRRLTRTALVGACSLVALATAGCATGVSAATTLQGPSGDGALATTGDLTAAGLLLVTADGTGRANLIGTVVNVGNDADAITGITIEGGGSATLTRAGSTTSSIDLPARSSQQIGYDAESAIEVTGLPTAMSQFVSVTISYRTAGSATASVLTVPDVGVWAGLGPKPAATA